MLNRRDRVFRVLTIPPNLARVGRIICAAWITSLTAGEQTILPVDLGNFGPKHIVSLMSLVSTYLCFDCETISVF